MVNATTTPNTINNNMHTIIPTLNQSFLLDLVGPAEIFWTGVSFILKISRIDTITEISD